MAVITAAAALLWLRAAWTLREHHPPVWPDEALFAEPALRLLQRGEFATDQLAGLLPGMAQHTFWVPPAYPLLLSGVFAFTGPGLLPVRLTSLAIGVVALALLYAVGRRAGLGRHAALLPVAVVAADVLFLRASLVGRMDGLCVVSALAALWCHLRRQDAADDGREGAWRWAVLTGVAAGLSALSHPMGLVAAAAVLLASWSTPPSLPRLRGLALVAAGVSAVLLPWLLWGLAHRDDFVAQLGAQWARKAGKAALAAPWQSVRAALAESGVGESWVGVGHVVGLLGLVDAARRRRALAVVLLLQLGWLALIVASHEMWYPAYAVPLAALGLGLLAARLWSHDAPAPTGHVRRAARAAPRIVGALALTLTLALGLGHLERVQALMAEARQREAAGLTYGAYCDGVAAALPAGARVLLAVIPDPWLGLRHRPDLTLRQFAPTGLGVADSAWQRLLRESDRVVVGRNVVSPEVAAFLRHGAVLEAEVGDARGPGGYARVYRVVKP